MTSIGGRAGYYPHHQGYGQPGVKIHNDVNVATPYHHNHQGYHHGYPYHHRPLGIGHGAHPAHGAVGGANPLDPQHGIFGNIGNWVMNHRGQIANVATGVIDNFVRPHHGLNFSPDAHKKDAKILEISEKLEKIDKREREKEAELNGLMRRKHVLSSAIQARVMNNHLEHLTKDAAGGDSSGDD